MNKYMIVDGVRVEYDNEVNILDVVRRGGVELPTFCYYSELSVYGACRMCVVEDEWGGIIASCSTPPRDKMQIKTNTPKLQKYRKMILELLLASHCRDCTTCEKSGKCKLQELASRFGIKGVRFPNGFNESPIDDSSNSIVRDQSKCILCGDCVRMCNEVQNVGAIDFAHRGAKMIVTPAFEKSVKDTPCVNCGQCAAVCPTGAIVVKSQNKQMWDALHDDTKRIAVQIAPAVRVALGEEFGIENGQDVIGKTSAALRKLGFDEIYDTSLGADLTIMEESKEFLNRLDKGENLPLFTSCCPAWVRYVENNHPHLMNNVSSCRSPMQMFSPVIKEHFAGRDAMEGKTTLVAAIMPCSAKKDEAKRDEFRNAAGIDPTDFVITTYELAQMIKEAGIDFKNIKPEASDMPFSLYSGGGVIFGVTGGVTEAVIRRVMDDKSQRALNDIEYCGVRGDDGIKEFDLDVDGTILKVAVVSGLANAEEVIRKMESGEATYHFIEVMACPGGCVCGAGQPFSLKRGKEQRTTGMYKSDKLTQFKRSEENPMIVSLYGGLLKGKTKEMLHVHYHKREEN